MDLIRNHSKSSSPSSSSSSSTPHPPPPPASSMHSWWESVSKQRSRILSLSSLLPSHEITLSSLADSDSPALSLLSSPSAYALISSSLSSSSSGSGSDSICQWLYDTFLSSDPHLRLLVLSFLPLVSGIYLSRIHSSDSSSSIPSVAGFEAVLLAVYSSEVSTRSGKPLLVHIPDLSQPSLYHTPRTKSTHDRSRQSVGVLSPPLEPQVAVKSTKRAIIVGTSLDCYYKQISQMPTWSKIEFCRFAAAWAGQDCPCRSQFDTPESLFQELSNGNAHDHYLDAAEEMSRLNIGENAAEVPEIKAVRVPLPWELLRPVITILGHCLFGPSNSQDAKDAASAAVRSLYARASHDLSPQAILALQSLIRLDNSTRSAAAKETAVANSSSEANTPSKDKKPEILLVSK